MPTVTKIPAKLNRATFTPIESTAKRRVAGYARVSTDSDEQLTSYEAQVDYYTNFIKGRSDWEFVAVYTDEGISATNTKHRDGFNRMIEDALAGRINLIVTKSVSRFARNTVDSLITVRKLKEKGVEVYFEKENIYTLDSKGELLITLMSSLAQEESRSISENVTWGQRKRMADGKVTIPYGRFLGYRKGDDGLPEIVPEEAEIVRLIYRSFMEGLTPNKIAQMLMKQNIPAPSGKEKWYGSTITSILTNEKYKGSALLQKKFTVDFLTKKQKVNEGEVPQYFVENSHPPIIDPDEFALVQAEIARRKAIGRVYSSSNIFSTKIICSCCGGYFGSKVWHSTSKYRRVIWQCNHKFQNGEKCCTPHLYEDALKEKFVTACGKLNENKEDFLAPCRQVSDLLSDCTALDEKIQAQYQYLNALAEAMQAFIKENAMHPQNEDFYNQKMAEYEQQKSKAEKVLKDLQSKKASHLSRKDLLDGMIRQLTEQDMTITAFDEKLWRIMVENVTVGADGELTFLFRNGMKIEV
ncbi:MAG: recombinase family protein [Alistipes sp.]|nr:recombinase family protein [Alistipes sp.]